MMGPIENFHEKISIRSGGQARAIKGLQAILVRPIERSRPPSQPLNNAELNELHEIARGFG